MSSSGGVFAILNLLSGNSLLHLTVFAIGILPYITASSTIPASGRTSTPVRSR
jgi:preprotein translocase subunit SecY